jgi:hypothetical protein
MIKANPRAAPIAIRTHPHTGIGDEEEGEVV